MILNKETQYHPIWKGIWQTESSCSHDDILNFFLSEALKEAPIYLSVSMLYTTSQQAFI